MRTVSTALAAALLVLGLAHADLVVVPDSMVHDPSGSKVHFTDGGRIELQASSVDLPTTTVTDLTVTGTLSAAAGIAPGQLEPSAAADGACASGVTAPGTQTVDGAGNVFVCTGGRRRRLELAASGAQYDSCMDLPPGSPSGVYSIAGMHAFCDMEKHGGGWLLALSYEHKATEAYPVVPGVLPLDPWHSYSHASVEQLQRLARPTSLRFFCNTSAHSRVLHFTTTHPNIIDFMRGMSSGLTTPTEWRSWNTNLLADHTAALPMTTTDSNADNEHNDRRMVGHTFYQNNAAHFHVDFRADHRFECDDYHNGGGTDGYSTDTLHQIWIR